MSTDLLGTKIRELRKKKGLTLKQLGDSIGSSKSYIWAIENKRLIRPSVGKVEKIAIALGVTLDSLLDREECPALEITSDRVFFERYKKMDKPSKLVILKFVESYWCLKAQEDKHSECQ